MKQFVILLCAAGLAGCLPLDEPPQVTVQGYGEVKAMPDSFRLSITPAGTGSTTQQAIAAMNRELNELRSQLPQMRGLEQIEFTSSDVNLYSVRDPECTSQYENQNSDFCPVEQYYAYVDLSVEASPAKQAGNLLSLASEMTGSEISTRAFSVSNRGDYKNEALAAAVADARARAKDLAEASGMSVGEVLKITPSDSNRWAYDLEMAPEETSVRRERVPQEAIEIDVAPQTISAEVEVVFALKPRAED
ncbi:SIMPL domain-containing protein [Parvularcula maris]|uniref:SIMPL domain-containing protein n=1 Tax=Parvularcula maris TaxID=2965077 RepID=A0A9X2LBD4_9PROT|nr:SIMPL domain-containing protein [Parvularcula maris]MCQ8186595.1 SIMPL domain-containing protein [Parvularcula maris]